MKFRTAVKLEKQPGFISHKDRILAVGSCFSSNIGGYLHTRRLNIKYDQFGILFNPISIAKNIQNSLDRNLDENLVLERDGKFYHYDFPSNVLGLNEAHFLNQLAKIQEEFVNEFHCANRLMITFGTAWVYCLIEQNKVVANCHKVPQKAFTKELLDLEELKTLYTLLFKDLKKENPNLEIILTVSPVRHIKNGLRENNLSKSILLLLTDFLSRQFDFVRYFPAYELVIDDLRDYRFFTEDMIHPNSQAIDYVYERFQEAYFSERTIEIVELSMKLFRLEHHNFLSPSAKDIAMNREKVNDLKSQIERLKSQL